MSTGEYVLTIDQSHEATSARVHDAHGQLVTSATVPYVRANSLVESAGAYRPRQIIDDMCEVVMDVLGVAECEPGAQPGLTATVDVAELAGVAFTHEPDDVIVWDTADGLPICDAISADDTRASDIAADISARLGSPVAPTSVLARLAWVLENVEGARGKAEAGRILYGNPTCWMLWNLSGGVDGLSRGETRFVTSRDAAEATGLFDSTQGVWDEAACSAAGIPIAMLPEVKDGVEQVAACRSDGVMPGVPIHAR